MFLFLTKESISGAPDEKTRNSQKNRKQNFPKQNFMGSDDITVSTKSFPSFSSRFLFPKNLDDMRDDQEEQRLQEMVKIA